MPAARFTARDRAMRRDRIFARLLDGQSAAAVAAEEGITPRRVRQMVREALVRWDANPTLDYADLQIARLETAFRALEAKVAEGDVSVVDKFVKVLGLMEKYHQGQLQATESVEDERDREAAFMDWQARLAASRAAVAARLAVRVRRSAPPAAAETPAPAHEPCAPTEAAPVAGAATRGAAAILRPGHAAAEAELPGREVAAATDVSPAPVENPWPAQPQEIWLPFVSRV